MMWRLIADVGGTNIRFARVIEDDTVVDTCSYPILHFKDFSDSVTAYIAETIGHLSDCTAVAIGAAGPVHAGAVHLTNVDWTIREAEVTAEIGAPCMLVNDVEAAAYCLPALTQSEFQVIESVPPTLETAHRLLAANIGTGFGAASLTRTHAGWLSSPSEAGHMSLPLPEDDETALRAHFKSVEDVLSGRGLSKLHAILGGSELHAAEICDRVPVDPKCKATVALFTRIMGDVLGNLALATGAWDGVFLIGSVAKGVVRVADHESLRAAFENKGPMNKWMKHIPLAMVEKQDAALWGLAVLPVRQKI